jgi:hypothetical protein
MSQSFPPSHAILIPTNLSVPAFGYPLPPHTSPSDVRTQDIEGYEGKALQSVIDSHVRHRGAGCCNDRPSPASGAQQIGYPVPLSPHSRRVLQPGRVTTNMRCRRTNCRFLHEGPRGSEAGRCNICFNDSVKVFGLMSDCNHTFCIGILPRHE